MIKLFKSATYLFFWVWSSILGPRAPKALLIKLGERIRIGTFNDEREADIAFWKSFDKLPTKP